MLSIEEIGFGVQERRVPLQAPVREDVAVAIFSGKRNPSDNHFSRSFCQKKSTIVSFMFPL